MSVVPPVEAATVVLARPESAPNGTWECFMVRRHVLSDFASNVFVFPGGKVDPADRDPSVKEFIAESSEDDCTRYETAGTLPVIRMAAIRELFEEAGVLLAQRRDGSSLSLDAAGVERFAAHRHQIHAGELTMADLARREELLYPVGQLCAISRWVTPESFSKRFDTHFFLALMPEGQVPIHDEYETTDSIWISPGEALRRYREGTFPLVFATEKNLERIARYPSTDALISSLSAQDLEPVMPRPLVENGETRFLLPGDEGY